MISGPRRCRPVLAAMKVRGLSTYSSKVPGHEMPTRVEEVGAGHTGDVILLGLERDELSEYPKAPLRG